MLPSGSKGSHETHSMLNLAALSKLHMTLGMTLQTCGTSRNLLHLGCHGMGDSAQHEAKLKDSTVLLRPWF